MGSGFGFRIYSGFRRQDLGPLEGGVQLGIWDFLDLRYRIWGRQGLELLAIATCSSLVSMV